MITVVRIYQEAGLVSFNSRDLEGTLRALQSLEHYLENLVDVPEMTPTHLVVRSEIDAARLQTSTFEGSVEEMRPVIEFTALFLLVGWPGGDVDDNAVAEYAPLLEDNPLVKEIGLYEILEHQQSKACLLAALRVSKEDFVRGMELDMQDLVPALELAYELDVSLGDILRMAAPGDPASPDSLPA